MDIKTVSLVSGCLVLFSSIASAAAPIVLPGHVPFNPRNPASAFSSTVRAYFNITAEISWNPPEACNTKEDYILTDFLYRGAVDHTFYAVYGPADRSLSGCWLNVQSRSDELAYIGTQWNGPAWTDGKDQQVYCALTGNANGVDDSQCGLAPLKFPM